MIKRVLFAYLGAVGLPLLFLPIATINTMGGHSLMYISLISSPIGMLAALSYSDFRRRYGAKAILIRSAMSLVIFILSFVVIVFLSEAGMSSFLKNQGWILMVVASPLITAITTENILIKQS